IADFVRVAHRGHRAMDHRRPGELAGDQHRTLDVDVGVDKPRQEIGRRLVAARAVANRIDALDAAIADMDGASKDLARGDVDNLGGYGHWQFGGAKVPGDNPPGQITRFRSPAPAMLSLPLQNFNDYENFSEVEGAAGPIVNIEQ